MSSSSAGSLHVVGLTGGVASGKSIVASELKTFSIPVLNLDDIGRSLMMVRSTLWDDLVKVCGPTILLSGVTSGGLDRKRLREIIFGDESLRQQVEAILHPLIWNMFLYQSSQLEKQNKTLVVCEAALLVESSLHQNFEELVVVSAPVEVRKLRLIARDQIDDVLAAQMVQAQLEESARNAKGSVILTNHGSEEDLREQARGLVERWRNKGWL
jgi:dephospho-CoA kinase